MGKNTWSSIPCEASTRAEKKYIVITRSPPNLHDDIAIPHEAYKTLDACYRDKDIDQFLSSVVLRCTRRSITPIRLPHHFTGTVGSDVPCDTFFPELDIQVFGIGLWEIFT
jgi:dihydrofolate reductase